MKKIILLVTVLALALALLPAMAEEPAPKGLGGAMPDFTVVDTEGNSYTLSELLKEKDLVHICVFATWCGPCKREFPQMEKVYEAENRRLEILALSGYGNDTTDKLTKYKADMGLSFPVGHLDGTGVADVLDIEDYPTNIFIDRFGNIAYARAGAFPGRDAYQRMVDFFLSDSYTETRTLLDFLPPEIDAEIPDPKTLSAALNTEGGAIAFSCVDDGSTYPFTLDARNGRAAAFASNLSASRTYAVISANVAAGEGDALAFEVGSDLAPNDGYLTVFVDGLPAKYVCGRHNYDTCAIPLTAGEHELHFVHSQIRAIENASSFMALRNVALLTGDEARQALAVGHDWPTSGETGITLLNESARDAVVTVEGQNVGLYFSVLDDDILRFMITLTEEDDPETCLVMDTQSMTYTPVASLPVEDGVYIFECRNASPTDYLTVALLTDPYDSENSHEIDMICARSGESADAYPQSFSDMGISDLGWCYADALDENDMDPDYAPPKEAETGAEAAPEEQPDEATYTVHVVDQNGDPVPEAAVGFCVDTGCMPIEADENGVATYTGAPTRYHLKVVDAPGEYDYPDDTDIYIGPESGEQTLVITREE